MVGKTKPATRAEKDRMDAIKLMRCICCEIDGLQQPLPTEVDHSVENGYRKHSGGHMGTTPKCRWHHRGVCIPGFTESQMRGLYGPSKAKHGREFRAHYGTDTELRERVDAKLPAHLVAA